MQMALQQECKLTLKDTNLSDIAAATQVGHNDTKLAAVRHYRTGAPAR